MSVDTLHSGANVPGVALRASRVSPLGLLRWLLDAGLALTSLAALAFVLVGRVDLDFLSVSGLAKPFLQALVLGSIRVAIGGDSWLPRGLRAAWGLVAVPVQAATDASPLAGALLNAAVALLSTRLAAKAVGFAARLVYPEHLPRSFEMPFAASRFAETFAAWDSAWYVDVASRGYTFDATAQSSIAFFPLYPLLMRALAWPFGGSERALWTSGIVIAYAAFFVALVLLHRVTERVTGNREAARRAQLYLCVFPFSFPFTRVYTESLFLALSLAATWCALGGRWFSAGGWGALAALSRPNGVLIAVPLALLALRDRPSPGRLLARGQAVALVPLGLAGYCAYAFTLSGDPLAWLNAQAQWGYSIGHLPWAMVQRLIESIEAQGVYGYLTSTDHGVYALSHAVIGLAIVALTPSIYARLGPAFGLYVGIGILIPLSANSLEGIGRYAATLFPVFIHLGATVRSQRQHEALLIGSALWLALNISLFVTQRPVY